MGANTEIGWTDDTFNPWWGCTNVSPGCDHCYAEAFAKRTGHDVWGKGGERRFFGDKHWAEPVKWNQRAEGEGVRRRVFCASMADVFEDRRDLDGPRGRLFALVESTPWLDWQLLTKRPEQVLRLAPPSWTSGGGWPANAWIGTTVEDQRRADLRIPRLLAVPACVRFLSCEPLLGPVDLGLADDHRGHERDTDWSGWGSVCLDCSTEGEDVPWTYPAEPRIHWVIVGGESGPRHRPMNLEWARSLRDQAVRGGVPLFFKQVGGRTPKAGGRVLDGREWSEFPA